MEQEIFVSSGAEPKLKFFTQVTKHDDGYAGSVSVEHGTIGLFVSELRPSRRSLECVIEIDVPEQSEVSAPFRYRIDLRSNSAIKNLVSSLNNAFGGKREKEGYNWERILNGFIAELSDKLEGEQKSSDVSDLPFTEPEFLLRPFLQKDSSNLVFASSEVGKSFFALRMAVSLITGDPFLGHECIGGKRTLYIDYEDSQDSYASRLHKICRGLGVNFKDVAPFARYYKPMGSFVDNVNIIKHMVAAEKTDLIIIDAGGDATGGSPSDEQKVLDFFNALEEVPVTKLILHHEPKNVLNEGAAFYGSMYWKARARVAWRLETESEESSTKLIRATIQKRSNLPYQEPFYYKIAFDAFALEDFGNTNLVPAITLNNALHEETGIIESEITKLLRENGELSASQMAQMLGKDRSTVWRVLTSSLKQRVDAVKDGKNVKYSLHKP